MATKKFDEIRGVVLHKKGTPEDDLRRYAYSGEEANHDIVSRGDTIFSINLDSMSIERCTVKMVIRERSGMIKLFYCSTANLRDYIPINDNFYGRNIPDAIKRDAVMYNKSSYGLLFTNMTDAVNKFEKIKNGKYFGALKKGDVIYMVDKANNKIVDLIVEGISHNDEYHTDNKHFNITTNLCDIDCFHSEFEDSASRFSDSGFYLWHYDIDKKLVSIHMDKAVAEKVLREYNNNRKNVQKKKDEQPPIPLGTPIRHTDNKGKELHYGDMVSYVRRNGLHGHTDISFGIVVGDSEQKIKILDEEEAKVGKKVVDWWKGNRGGFEESNGIHILEKVNVLRVKEIVKAE